MVRERVGAGRKSGRVGRAKGNEGDDTVRDDARKLANESE